MDFAKNFEWIQPIKDWKKYDNMMAESAFWLIQPSIRCGKLTAPKRSGKKHENKAVSVEKLIFVQDRPNSGVQKIWSF